MLKLVTRFSPLVIGSAVVCLGAASLVPAINPFGNRANATAPTPPQLAPARLNGQPVYVLYMTRSSDRVLVRCYPGQQPKVAVKTKVDGTKEGTLTCGS